MNQQLTIYDAIEAVGDTDSVSPTERGDTKIKAIQRFLDQGKVEPTAHIKKYRPNGRKTEYYRLDYRLGEKPKSLHIPGGNIYARLAQVRVKKLQGMIDRGAELAEIIAALQDYRS